MGNPIEGAVAATTPSTCSTCGPSRRSQCQFGEKCFRKNADHRKEFSHPGDLDWAPPGMRPEGHQPGISRASAGHLPGICGASDGHQPGIRRASAGHLPGDIQSETGQTPAVPAAEGADGVDGVEERGLLGAAGGAAAAWGGMKMTGADEKIGFLGRAGLIVGAAVAGHLLQDQMTGGKKSKKDKKGKKDKKHKKHKSRGLSQEDSDSDSSSCNEGACHGLPTPAISSACPRPRCEFGDKCFRKNPDHKEKFCHPDDADWTACAGS